MNAQSPLTVAAFSEKDAKDIIFAEVLEKHAFETKQWDASQRDAATRDAQGLTGNLPSKVALLPIRARLVIARMHERLKGVDNIHTKVSITFPWTVTLALFALLFGALTDYLATDGARINLLAPPLLGLLLWNLAIYFLLIAKALQLLPFELPMRHTVTQWLVKFSTYLPKANPIQRAFTEKWMSLVLPQYKLRIARAFHLAAMTFACGLLLGVAIRGIGTAYHVGWESTWFANQPALIHTFFDWTYGLFPAAFLGLPDMPSVSDVAQMAFGSSASSDIPASPWIIRLMMLIVGVVIIPRSLLVLYDTIKLRWLSKHIAISLKSPYYRNLLSETPVLPQWTGILINTPSSDEELPEKWRQVANHLKQASNSSIVVSLHAINAWNGTIADTLKHLPVAEQSHVLIVFDPTSTPEEEVHGQLLNDIYAWGQAHHINTPIVGLDLSRMVTRYGEGHPLIGSRTALWQTFVAEHHCRSFTFNIDDEKALDTIATQLRTSNP